MKSERDETMEETKHGDVLVNMDVVGDELWREYDFVEPATGISRVYKIAAPVTVEYRLGGTTHRVTDADDVTHVVPAPGYHCCVVRIGNRPSSV